MDKLVYILKLIKYVANINELETSIQTMIYAFKIINILKTRIMV